MPYIPQAARLGGGTEPAGPGELAYRISQVFDEHLVDTGDRFWAFAEVFGVTILTLLDLYTRIIEPYERRKQEENGDVYAPR